MDAIVIIGSVICALVCLTLLGNERQRRAFQIVAEAQAASAAEEASRKIEEEPILVGSPVSHSGRSAR